MKKKTGREGKVGDDQQAIKEMGEWVVGPATCVGLWKKSTAQRDVYGRL